ncbi:MAG: hypothetical protein HN348_33480, partial [Proteobacteria bacterium]|nr:hypothetical protein [Pseudomonadota bacterium]
MVHNVSVLGNSAERYGGGIFATGATLTEVVVSGNPESTFDDPDGTTNDIGAYGVPNAAFDYYSDIDLDGMYDGWEDVYGLDTQTDDSADDGDGGLRISDDMNATEFSTDTVPVFFGGVNTGFQAFGRSFTLDGGVEMEGSPVNPSKLKVTANAFSPIPAGTPQPNETSLQSIVNALRARPVASVSGCNAIAQEIQRAMGAQTAPRTATGTINAGFSVEFEWVRRNGRYQL